TDDDDDDQNADEDLVSLPFCHVIEPQQIEVEVYDEFVTAGNTAVFRCHLSPSTASAHQLLQVVAWLETTTSTYIFPETAANTAVSNSGSSSSFADSKYRVLTTGELYVANVQPADALKSFRCQVKHRYSGNSEKRLSSTSGRIFVSEAFSSQAPRIVDTKPVVIVEEGKPVELGCLAHGHPLPSTTWYRHHHHHHNQQQQQPSSEVFESNTSPQMTQSPKVRQGTFWDSGGVSSGRSSSSSINRYRILSNSLLIEKTIASADSGVYRCIVNNSLGSEVAETTLVVRAPLKVQITGFPVTATAAVATTTTANVLRVDLGQRLMLNCSVLGGGGSQSPPPKSIEWLHNGRVVVVAPVLPSAGTTGSSAQSSAVPPRIRLLSADVLHIARVVHGDSGSIFQCHVRNDFESAQAAVQLKLLSVFAEQTLQPGQPLTLKCIASGNPIPQVVWHIYDSLPIPDHISRYRIGDYVTRDSLLVSYVNISSVLPEDGGIYSCTAANDVASVRHSARINVFGKPSVRRMSNMTAVAGESISITCPVGGYPIDVIIWEREGVRLPYNHRQKVFPNGTLTIGELERVTDQGTLSCIARTRDDPRSSAKTSFSLKVLVRPVIEPFKFPKSLHQSQRYNLLCTVVKGDPPIKIEWFKDGKKLTAGTLAKTNIIHVTEYSVTLAFESVQPEHRVPPRWRIEPGDTNVVKGRNSVIDCDADAYPPPVITWSRADGLQRELPSDFKPINSNGHFRPYENGSLAIHNANKLDTGFFMCAASNGVGHISKVIKIAIQVAAHFETKFRTETVHRGLEARIKCSAVGDKPITISWFKDKAPFLVNEDNRYDLIETILNEGIKSELIIRNSDRRDGGLYTCLTSNSYGRDDTNVQLIVQEPPDAPTDIKVAERDGRSVRLVWSQPYSGNSPLTHYVLQHKLENEKWSAHFTNISVLASESSVSIGGLQPTTAYQVRLFAVNSLGRSEPSDVVSVLTAEETPGGPPLHIKTMPLSSTSVKVNWKPPRRELQYGLIRGYYIGYRVVQSQPPSSSSSSSSSASQDASSLSSSSSSSSSSSAQVDVANNNNNYIFKTIEVKSGGGGGGKGDSSSSSSAEECTVTDLKRASQYEIIVQAFNSKGAGPTSEPVYVKTLEFDPPSAPSLQVSEVTFSYVRLSWATPADQIVTGYILHFKRESGDWEELRLPDGTSFMHEALRCGTRYQYYLVGFNSAGKGDPSQVVSARTDGTSPVAPDKNSLLSVNSTSAAIYLDSFHDGGCKISNFEVMYKLDRSHSWSPVALSSSSSISTSADQKLILLSDLQPGSKYQLRVTAFNQAGSTEAEYSFLTPITSYQDGPAILMGSNRSPSSSTGGSNGSSSVPFYADFLVIVPSVISFVVVVVLLSLVYIIFTRKPRHPNDIYGTFDGDHKLQGNHCGNGGGGSGGGGEANEAAAMMLMGELDLNGNGGKKGGGGQGGFHHLMDSSSAQLVHSKYPQQQQQQVHACHPVLMAAAVNNHNHNNQSPSRNAAANSNFQTPYAMTSMVSTDGSNTFDDRQHPQLHHLHHSSPLKSQFNLDNHDMGIYATVKRGTPRVPRTADVHIYQYPRHSTGGGVQQADILHLGGGTTSGESSGHSTDNNNSNSIDSHCSPQKNHHNNNGGGNNNAHNNNTSNNNNSTSAAAALWRCSSNSATSAPYETEMSRLKMKSMNNASAESAAAAAAAAFYNAHFGGHDPASQT
ncbi:hypothetical protein TYRP_013848, partial [Tyrophagus putrescentiae]